MVFFIGILLWVSIIDIRKHIIPDKVLLFAIGARVIYFLCHEGLNWKRLSLLCLDGLVVSIPLLVIILVFEHLLKKELMGGGDIKLLFVTGLFLGWEKNLWTLLWACIIGIGVGLLWVRNGKRNTEDSYFPFGPSIAIGAVIASVA